MTVLPHLFLSVARPREKCIGVWEFWVGATGVGLRLKNCPPEEGAKDKQPIKTRLYGALFLVVTKRPVGRGGLVIQNGSGQA